jgi:hypothetical protein
MDLEQGVLVVGSDSFMIRMASRITVQVEKIGRSFVETVG